MLVLIYSFKFLHFNIFGILNGPVTSSFLICEIRFSLKCYKDSKDFYKLLFVIYWPTGVFGVAFALWIRFSSQVKAFFSKK